MVMVKCEKKTMEVKESKASMILGIISLCTFWLTWPSMILAIIGLCVKKSETHAARDWTLNIIGLVISTIYTIFILSIMMATLGL